MLNLSGYHSAAVTLFRPLEDALDCFAAVLLIGGAAERWRAGKLRASDAAKEWTSLEVDIQARGVNLAEYRKRLRAQFHNLTHCSHELCEWNLYFASRESQSGPDSSRGDLLLNYDASIIYANAHGIDAHLTAHLLEFLVMLKRGYSKYLNAVPKQLHEVEHLLQRITAIMEEHDRHQCQQTFPTPEIRRLKYVGKE